MRIRRLEITGFKSFADRAVIRFGDGITGVVGPNGCGKSNVVDAIRWCMGEMSAKNLRGRAMQDVIFAGCESRGPLGLAEVSLVFENDGNVPPQYAGFTEIEVTRRLYRDGTSEYLLNKIPARLRDITDLFLGTGVGTRAYSIIEQGRIGFIVSSRPEDRRTIIEEVAGITKFKARKKAAERRMEATEQNLLRVNDIVGELERQLVSLRRQAKKAERYKKLKEELRDVELHQATLELLRLRGVDMVNQQQQQALEQRLQEADTVSATDETEIESHRLQLLEEERQLQIEQKLSAESDSRFAALERDLDHWKRQLIEAQERANTAQTDVEQARLRIQQAQTDRAGLMRQATELSGSLGDDRNQVGALAEQVASLQARIRELDARGETLRKEAVEHVHQVAQQKSRVESLARQRTQVWERIAQATTERDNESERLKTAELQKQEFDKGRSERQVQVAEWRGRQQVAQQMLTQVSSEASQGEAAVLSLKGKLAETESRLSSLHEIAKRMEGYSSGIRSLMGVEGDKAAAGTANHAVAGMEQLVADILESQASHEKAIEAALGDKLQAVIVESLAAGKSAIDYLKACDGGRGGFIPKHPRDVANASFLTAAGVVGKAVDLVTVKPGYEQVARYLLSDVVLVDTLDHALAAFDKITPPCRLVTLDGEVLDAAGGLVGGSESGAGLLAKRREMRELEARVEDLQRQLSRESEAQEARLNRRLQLEVDIQQLDKDLRATEVELMEIEKDLQVTAAEMTRLSDRIEVLGYEIAERKEDLARIDDEQAEATEAAESAEERRFTVESELTEIRSVRESAVEEHDMRSQGLMNARVALAAREEKLTAAQDALERLANTEADLRHRIERGEGAIEGDTELVASLEEKIQEGQARAEETIVIAQERRERLSQARAAYEAKRAAMSDREQSVKLRRRQVDTLKEAANQLKLEVQKVDMERQRLIDQMAERHEVNLLKVAGDYHLRPMPGPEALEHKVEIDRAIKAIGPINLTAIEECAEIETRHAFLVRQRDDLQTALDALKRAIQRINRASRERFMEAFTAVNDMFVKVFPRLFRGGEARLELTESDDVLEAGVEIVAQPPGKKLQSVGLLSGGEKALTATALVFSIFLVKPSPFCILDEVDAPLDEANVGRFNDMLREISEISQFIVITHNKNTMTQSDKLYGITMEERGMSKVVSVDLSQRQVQAA